MWLSPEVDNFHGVHKSIYYGGYMKKIIFSLFILLLPFTSFADPTVFGMTLGKTTEKETADLYSGYSSLGENRYSHGNMYNIPVKDISFDGLQEVTAIFDSNGILVAVLAKLPKEKFDYINSSLKKKYKLISQQIPFVGNKFTKYSNGNTQILLDAPHLSFEMTLSYLQTNFYDDYNKQVTAEQRKKSAAEQNQL